MTFALKVKKGTKQYMVDAMAIVEKEFERVSNQIVRDTPVDTGKLKNNWSASFGSPASGVNRRDDFGSGRGAESYESIKRVVNGIDIGKLGTHIFLTNCLEYGAKMEFGGFETAPQGFLITNVMSAGKTFK